jgi:hypothetical protein
MTAIAIRVTRYQCPHCHRTRSTRRAAEAHIARCFKNPEARSCKTCAAYQPPEGPDYSESGRPIYPGCAESCHGGVDISGGLKVGCEHWEVIW